MHLAWILVLAIVHLAVMARSLLVESRDPYSRAAWLLMLILAPGIGTLIYLFFGEPWVARRFLHRMKATAKELKWVEDPDSESVLGSIAEPYRSAFKTCERLSRWPVVGGNSAVLADDSNAAIDAMVGDFDRAQGTIHVSFYIWLPDKNGLKVAAALERAAKRGVTCRVMVDAIGSRILTRSEAWDAMRRAGVRLCISLEGHPGLRFLVNNRIDLRNHRKIVIIDDRITYCGSQNCADPEFRIKPKFAPWVDIMLRFEGPVARQNQLLFANAWMVETAEDLADLCREQVAGAAAEGVGAIAFGTGPTSPKGAMSGVFVSVLYSAEREVTVSTPYFVPDPPLLEALIACARRGVATSLVLPARNDSPVVGAISRATYAQLIKEGVRIFEFKGGLLHAKTLVVDRTVALIGSSNMDRRSLELNFENNILLYSPEVAGEIRQRQDSYLASAVEITREDMDKRSVVRILFQNLLTIFAPIF